MRSVSAEAVHDGRPTGRRRQDGGPEQRGGVPGRDAGVGEGAAAAGTQEPPAPQEARRNDEGPAPGEAQPVHSQRGQQGEPGQPQHAESAHQHGAGESAEHHLLHAEHPPAAAQDPAPHRPARQEGKSIGVVSIQGAGGIVFFFLRGCYISSLFSGLAGWNLWRRRQREELAAVSSAGTGDFQLESLLTRFQLEITMKQWGRVCTPSSSVTSMLSPTSINTPYNSTNVAAQLKNP